MENQVTLSICNGFAVDISILNATCPWVGKKRVPMHLSAFVKKVFVNFYFATKTQQTLDSADG